MFVCLFNWTFFMILKANKWPPGGAGIVLSLKLLNIFISVKPDVTLSLKDADLVDLMTGKLNPQKAFFQGKLKVQGNMGLAMKLQEFQKQAGAAMKAKL
jgi:predicted lipid carrier protein YhbT